MLRRMLREPLLHFLLLGGLLFAVFSRSNPEMGVADRHIVLSRGDIDRLATAFTRTWNRPPDQHELQAQIQDEVREEVLYREAIQLGLDKDDSIIRRRLRQKMEFLFEDTVPPPTEPELRAYLEAHSDKFRLPPLISFRQAFVSTRRGDAAEGDARQILAHLVAETPGAEDTADPLLLGDTFSRAPLDRIAALFGDDFAQELSGAAAKHWVGPFRSAYGLHLVLVTAVEPAATPPFERVRAAVEREWFAERRSAAQAAQYETILARFTVTMQDRPATAP